MAVSEKMDAKRRSGFVGGGRYPQESVFQHAYTENTEYVMRVAAYHSINPTDPDVHHVHDNCPSGQQTPAHNRQPGPNGWPLCKHCRDI